MGLRPAGPWAVLSAATELVGGLLLIVGLAMPLTTALLIGQSVVIIALVPLPRGFWNKANGLEFPLVLAGAFLTLAATGPGSVSLDAWLGLTVSPAVRVFLLLAGVAGGVVALAVPHMQPRAPAAQPR